MIWQVVISPTDAALEKKTFDDVHSSQILYTLRFKCINLGLMHRWPI